MDEKLWEFLKVLYRDKNRNAGNVVKGCPENLAKKKVHQLTINEIKQLLTNLQRDKNGKWI